MSATQPVATRPARTGGAPASGRHLGLALLVIVTAQLMVVLDATIVNVALPHIQHALGFSGAGLESGIALAALVTTAVTIRISREDLASPAAAHGQPASAGPAVNRPARRNRRSRGSRP